MSGVVSANWDAADRWEFQLVARVDGNYQRGDQSFNKTKLDYGDSFVRYRSDNYRVTAGTQTVIWGRIDELAPTDRMSTQDLRRFVLDDLPDRRLSSPAFRYEGFFGDAKLDVVWLPLFRASELPDEESVWYPVNQTTGEIIGLDSTPLSRAIVKNANIIVDEPESDAGGGVRFSKPQGSFDYAVTLQRVRHFNPYFRYEPSLNALVAEYPRTWVAGGDVGFEAAGATWRFEAAWLSDIPVTAVDKGYTTVEGINWGGGVELYPGDGDTRVNLQIVGNNLVDAPKVADRDNTYSFNGIVDAPFARQRWRAKLRWFLGLDESDVYLNPGISFIGWEPHEIYLQGHYFDGDDGTFGGYHQDHSLLTLGWRAEF